MHEVFDTHRDDFGNVHFRCTGCNEGHTFKSDYFAKQWANRHATGVFVRLLGLADN